MKTTIKRIVEIIKPYMVLEILGLILTIIYTLAVFAAPMVSKYLIDEVLHTNSREKVYYGVGIFFAVCALQPIVGYFKDILFLNITENITFTIRERLFSKVIKAPLKFFDNTNRGDILSRIINDGRGASSFVTNLFVVFIKDVLLIIMILIGMIYLSPIITGSVLILFFLYFVLNMKLSKKFNQLSQKSQENFDLICTTINQSVNSITTIKSFQIEKEINEDFSKVLKNAYEYNKKIGYLSTLLNNMTSIVVILSLCIIYGLGTLMVMENKATLGTLIALATYFQLLVQPVYELQNNNIQYQTTIPIFDRIYEYFEMAIEKIEQSTGKEIKGRIDVKDVSFSYKDNVDVLNNINLQIPSKGLISLVGSSGSGKSTFVKLLLGLYKPTGGKIYISNEDIEKIGINALRKNISFVPQEIDLLNASVRENIICGNKSLTDNQIIDICKKVGIHDKFMSLPKGYGNIISERVDLSGGEKQRLGIARALIKNSSIVILDEPTSALDPENETNIRTLIEDIAKEKAVIVIAHKLSTILNSDRIVVFDKGKIVEQGTHASLIDKDGIYAKFILNSDNISQDIC